MNVIFENGLKFIRLYEEPIKTEWNHILFQLDRAGRKSKADLELTIQVFSEYLFNDKRNTIDLMDGLKNSWNDSIDIDFPTDQFIVTLLENAVHKVMQQNKEQSHHKHQAIQYLFASINDHILTDPYQKSFSIDTFLQHLVSSQQLPIEWAAIVFQNGQTLKVEKWFNKFNQDLLFGTDGFQANSIYELSEQLLKQMSSKEQSQRTVLPVPYEDKTLLIGVDQQEAAHIIPFITYSLQIYQNGKEILQTKREEQQWKDSVIMFNESIMKAHSFNESVENITSGFVNYLPFERCALFSYSLDDQMGIGLYGHHLDNEAIQNITEDISNLPIIEYSLQTLQLFGKQMSYLQPIYIADASQGFPAEYVKQFQLKTVVVAPIFTASSNKLLGAAILDQGPSNTFTLTQETFSALVKFGQSAGEILDKYFQDHHGPKQIGSVHLSRRELQVLKLMAEGASTSEAASKLNLSEYTVRDYVSAIMKKMNARNRTEAVARAIRDGMI